MKTSATILYCREAAARCLGWFTTMLCLASVLSTDLFSAENGISPGSFDQSFASHFQRGEVEAILVQPDRLLVGGQFRTPGVGTNLVRLTRDGAPDPTFTPTS